jgi:Mg2+ and Co2+ transporter CorA
MVRDLLRQDVQPKVETYGDEKDGVRGISVLAVIARQMPARENGDDEARQLIAQLVEIIVGPKWIVTCWHPGRIYTGVEERDGACAVLREPLLSHVRHRWLNDGMSPADAVVPKSSGDLGIYLARSLIDTYGASHRMLEGWVSSWEVAFYKSLNCADKSTKLKTAAADISNILSMVGEVRRRLTAFEHARWTTTDLSWFPSLTDASVMGEGQQAQSNQVQLLEKAVTSAAEKFDQLSGDIRGDMDLLMLQSTASQQELTEGLQRYLAKVTGLVLVPTLVAGLFGANTRLPGGGTWLGFEIMLTLMVVSSIAVYLVIRRLVR